MAAPVVSVYSAKSGARNRNQRVSGTASARSRPAIINVTIPTWAPEIAKMCTVPVAAKSCRKALGKSSR